MNLHSIKLLFGPEAGHLQPFFLRTEGRLQKRIGKYRQGRMKWRSTLQLWILIELTLPISDLRLTLSGAMWWKISAWDCPDLDMVGTTVIGHLSGDLNVLLLGPWRMSVSWVNSVQAALLHHPHHCASSCPHHVSFLLLNWSSCLQAQTPTLPGNLE